MPVEIGARSVSEAQMSAVIIRCGCGHPETHKGVVCPTPRSVEDYGVIGYWARNPLKRLRYWLKTKMATRVVTINSIKKEK